MNEIITDIKALQEETLINLKSSKANNTIRAYKSDFHDFELFCIQNGFKSLPSEPKIISLYLTSLSAKDIKMSTLKRRLVSIGVIHKLKGHYLDTKHPLIIENIMGIKRRKGSAQNGKKPLLINNLKALIKAINRSNSNPIIKFRDRTIVLIGFSGGFRRNEIVSLNYDDIEFVNEGMKINLRRSKTDQYGEGFLKGVPYFDNPVYCPVISMQNWLKISEINSGPLFRRFSKGSSNSISRAMVSPSLTMSGAPNFFSRTTFRPLGPMVTRTALARAFTPRSRELRDSSEKERSLAMMATQPSVTVP